MNNDDDIMESVKSGLMGSLVVSTKQGVVFQFPKPQMLFFPKLIFATGNTKYQRPKNIIGFIWGKPLLKRVFFFKTSKGVHRALQC